MHRSVSSVAVSALALSAAMITTAGLTGCQMKAKPPGQGIAMPISADQLEQIRNEFMQTDPGVKIGSVSDVLAAGEGNKLRVTGVSVADFKVGTVVSIIDAKENLIANGRVYATVDNAVDVDFTPAPGMRRPAIGDAAVKFSKM